MLEPILTDEQRALLVAERELLAEVGAGLERTEAASDDLRTLADSARQLDELFLLIVVGEFNAGKSALINALLGQRVLAEGATPTTSKLHRLGWGETFERRPAGMAEELISAPLETLRQLTIVDTPGTNALDRAHEALTTDFVPRADLVLFVTSADRPLSESERVFLESIRSWGKKVVMAINKVDILRSEDDASEVLRYVRDNASRLLGVEPEIFPLSARAAAEAQAAGDQPGLEASGVPDLVRFLGRTLDSVELLQLKLGNPLGVAEHLLEASVATVEARRAVLSADLQTIDDIERQTAAWVADVEREFSLRLADVDNVLLEMEQRGLGFFDETVRLGRLTRLFDRSRLEESFQEKVVDGVPEAIEIRVDGLIDWLVDSELGHWQRVVNLVNRRASAHADRMVGEVGSRFETDRARLLDTVGRAARDGLASYDRVAEGQRMADGLQKAVTSAAVLEVGAVGLGAAVALAATSTAADITGLTAAGLMAALGLFVLPHRRRRAKADFRSKIAALRAELVRALTRHFEGEAAHRRQRLAETIAPYTRFVRSESERLGGELEMLRALGVRVDELKARVAALG
jgi:small GTP-binding protein